MSRRVPPRGFFNGESPFGRLPNEPSFPTIHITRRAVGWILGIAIALLILFLLKPFATLYTDWLWFRALGYGGVFGIRFAAQIWSFFIFAIAFWAIGAANVLLALSGGRRLSSIGIRQRLLTAPSTILAMLVVFLLGLLFGNIASGQWQTTLTFLNQKPFHLQDPIFHTDVSFYVFSLPFYRFIWGWLLGVVILMMLVAGGLYFSRAGFQNLLLPARAIRHLSVLAGVFALLLAIHYRLDLWELLLSQRGFVNGIGYADVAARIPAYWIMTVLMLLIAAGLLANGFRGQLAPLPVALVAWLGAAFILLVIFPGFVQRFEVAPSELSRESPYIKNEIAFTRAAYGLNSIIDRSFTPSDTLSPDVVARNPQTVQNARLWDPQLALPATLENLQSLRTYYQFYQGEVAVDRYQLGGQYLQLLLQARELNPDRLSTVANTWVALKLQYTHGYGVVAARANEATPEGDPVLTLQNIPPQGEPSVSQGGIYFGRHTSDYVLVDSKQAELDYSLPQGGDAYTHWTGKTGVSLSSSLRSLAFAIRFGDVNLLISPQLTSQTQVLFNRAVQDRVSALAPFLQFDQDPYVVVVNGHIYWILDGYTVTDHYPYSAPSPDTTGPFVGVNYARNSIKVVVDAYDGTTTFYQIDSRDPLANTYRSMFPGLFKPFSQMPAGLQAHIRYPRDIFNLQAEQFQLYHITDPTVFYTREDLWNIAKETQQQSGAQVMLRPFYVIMRLPGEPKEEFVTILPYTPNGKTNMIAYLAARSDQPDYGTLFDFRFPKDLLVTGPQQVEANIDQAPAIKSQFALLNAPGSSVIRGNLLVLPIETSLLYIEPVYLESANVQKPQLKKVIVATGQNVVMDDTLDKALNDLFGGALPTAPTGPATQPTGTVAQLIADAKKHYDNAQAALSRGDFATYGAEIKIVGNDLNQLAALQSASASPSASPSASASASPSSSP